MPPGKRPASEDAVRDDVNRRRDVRRSARLVRAAERTSFVVGVVCLTLYGAACVHSSMYQSREQQAFDRALAQILHAETHDQSEWSRERVEKYEESRGTDVEALGRLDIPDASVSVMVLEGTDDWTLNRAVGRIEGTARPNEPGNLGIAGHRDGFFRGLRHLSVGDELTFTTLDGVGHYRVVDLSVVQPESVEVLAPTADSTITLVTCHPFYYVGDAPRRFIVHARRVMFEPWDALTPASEAVPSIAAAFSN
jgi:sortase A